LCFFYTAGVGEIGESTCICVCFSDEDGNINPYATFPGRLASPTGAPRRPLTLLADNASTTAPNDQHPVRLDTVRILASQPASHVITAKIGFAKENCRTRKRLAIGMLPVKLPLTLTRRCLVKISLLFLLIGNRCIQGCTCQDGGKKFGGQIYRGKL